ncbi:hypothetical protein AF332_24025 [Sporosarcina globispora]|uniref:Uncharacterized protein n=1 Tax=Sporosarcina globispora TaxID=1459 RepID=A0A0M0GIB5_SPOGL|nr:hypothetical protein [Sporosarcina globispora]KON89589.1 hypothetical protein AF332_24025 [Sporosarcina globispora]
MKLKKSRFIFISVLTLFYLLTFILSRYDTFAWFTSESTASAEITNATTSDLLWIKGEIQYEENCQLSSTVMIKNISTIDIPFSLELKGKDGSTHVISKTLHPNETFTSKPNITHNPLNDCTIKQVEYDLTALNSYIDETIILTVSQEKLKAASKQRKNELPAPDKLDTQTEKEDVDLAPKEEESTDDPSLPSEKVEESNESPTKPPENELEPPPAQKSEGQNEKPEELEEPKEPAAPQPEDALKGELSTDKEKR